MATFGDNGDGSLSRFAFLRLTSLEYARQSVER